MHIPSSYSFSFQGDFLSKLCISPSTHKCSDDFTRSGLSAIRQAHRPELIEGLSEQKLLFGLHNSLYLRIEALSVGF